MGTRRTHALAATTSSISWEFFEGDDFNCPRIDIVLASAPSSAGNITVTKDSAAGSAYDAVLRTVNPVGQTNITIEGLHGFVNGDKLLVEYANPDSISTTATSSLELLSLYDISAAGLTVDSGTIRSSQSNYRRYYHVALSSADPGASGATWTASSANNLSGWLLDSATEHLDAGTDVHQDWDTSTNPEVEFSFTVPVDNSTGTVNDTIDFSITAYYAMPGDTATRSQVISKSVTIGACDQYTVFKTEVDIDRNYTDNPIRTGDSINLEISVTAGGDVTAAIVNDISFHYNTTHVGIESTDT